MAVLDRDPACSRAIEPVLYFKGFQALQTHRLAHWLHGEGRQGFRALSAEPLVERLPGRHQSGSRDRQGRVSRSCDRLVVGETAVIEDDVSILQGVTLGGTGKEAWRPASEDPAMAC
jgi:serine O-acetyltransferase